MKIFILILCLLFCNPVYAAEDVKVIYEIINSNEDEITEPIVKKYIEEFMTEEIEKKDQIESYKLYGCETICSTDELIKVCYRYGVVPKYEESNWKEGKINYLFITIENENGEFVVKSILSEPEGYQDFLKNIGRKDIFDLKENVIVQESAEVNNKLAQNEELDFKTVLIITCSVCGIMMIAVYNYKEESKRS